jgi:hypothetical protein
MRRSSPCGEKRARSSRGLRQTRVAPVPSPPPFRLPLAHGGLARSLTGSCCRLLSRTADARAPDLWSQYISPSFFGPSVNDVEEGGHRG